MPFTPEWDPFRPRYGTWRGAALLGLSWLDRARGGFRAERTISWGEVRRLVFVCRGNICRSAYAEARARELGLRSASFGLKTSTGGPANEVAMRVAATRHVELSRHRTTDVGDFRLEDGDLLLAMEPRHLNWLRQSFAGSAVSPQVSLLGLWSRPRRPHLHDPHGLSTAYFATCFDFIDSAIETIAARWHAN
jgi:protein-tyrosine phosphatase